MEEKEKVFDHLSGVKYIITHYEPTDKGEKANIKYIWIQSPQYHQFSLNFTSILIILTKHRYF